MIMHRPRRRRPGTASGALPGATAAQGEPAGSAGSETPSDQWVRELKASLQDRDVSSAAIRSKMLTRMGSSTPIERPAPAGPRPRVAGPGRRHARPGTRALAARPAGGAASGGPRRARRARPRLVSVGALAAVAGVIGATAVVVASLHDGQPAMVSAPAGSSAPRPNGTTSAAATAPTSTSSALVDAAAASSAAVTQATPGSAQASAQTGSIPAGGAGGSANGGTDGQWGQGSQRGAARGARVDLLPRGSRLYLPTRGVVDWVVFGSGHGGVTTRAAIPYPLIDTRRIAGIGSARAGYDTTVSWSGGTPDGRGSWDDERLVVANGRSATMSVYRGHYADKFLIYLGGASRVTVRVTADGMRDSVFTLTLAGSDPSGVVTIDLGDLPAWTPATVAVTGAGGRSLSLAAAVLR